MSAAVMPRTRRTVRQEARVKVSLHDLMRAELTRSRRTFTWGVIGATLVFTVHTLVLSHASISSGVVKELQWNGNALGWMHLYAGAFAVPLGLLTGAMAQWREQRWRQGGTAWRAVEPRRVVAARIAVLSLSALACQVALIAPVVAHALVVGNGWGPWERYLLFAVYMWIIVTGSCAWGVVPGSGMASTALVAWTASTGSCAWGVVAFRVLRVVAVGVAPVLGFVWCAAGLIQAERSDWWALPWTWTARVPLPLLGVHGSSVLLEAGSPVWRYPLLPGFLLAGSLTLVGTAAAVLGGTPAGAESSVSCLSWLGRLRPRRRPDDAAPPPTVPERALGQIPEQASERALGQAPASAHRVLGLRATPATRVARALGTRSSVLALAGVLPWGVWVVLALLLLTCLGLVRYAYPPDYGQILLELLGVPVAAAVTGTTVWGRLEPAWGTLVTRRPAGGLLSSAVVLSGLFLVPVLVASWTVTVLDDTLTRTDPDLPAVTGPVYGLMVMPAVALMVAAVSLAVALCTRVVVAIVLNVILVVMGLLVGGNEVLAATWLWWLAPWGWIGVAHQFPERWLTVVVLSLLIGSAAMVAAALGSRRAAVRD